MKSLDNRLSRPRQYFSCAIASFACVCAGSVLAWTSPVLPQLTSGNDSLTLTESQGGLVGSMAAIGAMISSVPAGYVAENYGRKNTLSYLTLPFMVSWIVVSYSKNLGLLLFGRFLGGFASGAICVCVPMYVSEIASVEIRGVLGSFFQLGFCIGILLVNVMGAALNWKDLSLAMISFPVFHVVAMYFTSEAVKSEKSQNLKDYEAKPGFLTLLKKRNNKQALKVAIGLVACQQLSGINAVIFYTSTIFEAAGSTLKPTTSTIVVAAAQLIFSCISAALIEKFNRRFYLIISAVGMAFSLVMMAAYFHCKNIGYSFPGMDYLPLVSMVFFILSYCAGFGPIPWLMMGELFSEEFKGAGCGTATMSNWCLIFIVTAVFPIICTQIGEHNTFYMFSLFNLAAAFFAVYCVPETRGKTCSQIQANY